MYILFIWMEVDADSGREIFIIFIFVSLVVIEFFFLVFLIRFLVIVIRENMGKEKKL